MMFEGIILLIPMLIIIWLLFMIWKELRYCGFGRGEKDE